MISAPKTPKANNNIVLEGDQLQAYNDIMAYVNEQKQTHVNEGEEVPPYVLSGLAGSGKTSLIARVIKDLYPDGFPDSEGDARPVVCSPTGKAASVLNTKLPGGVRAQTIHSFLYMRPRDARATLMKRYEEVSSDFESKNAALADETDETIQAELLLDIQYLRTELTEITDKLDQAGRTNTLKFDKKPVEVLNAEAAIIFVDEASMVGTELARDLMAIGRPIIFLGDANQLPPIQDSFGVDLSDPTFSLTEIRRQAKDSGVLHLSREILEKGDLPRTRQFRDVTFSQHGNPLRFIENNDVVLNGTVGTSMPQFICYYNATRYSMTRAIREVRIFQDPAYLTQTAEAIGLAPGTNAYTKYNFLPAVGETLIVDDNRPDLGLLRGDTIKVTQLGQYIPTTEELFRLYIGFEDKHGMKRSMPIFMNDLMLTMGSPDAVLPSAPHKVTMKMWRAKNSQEASSRDDLGGVAVTVQFPYVLTCHKSQGSEWDRVVVYNERPKHGQNKPYLYTAITRSRKQLTLALT